jgi:DNA-binding NtrC family response regulator
VRELRNAVARRLALGDLGPPRKRAPSPPGSASDDYIDRVIASRTPFPRARAEVLAEFEQRYVTSVLAEHCGDITRAASASGIGKRYFQLIRARRSG